MPRQAVFFLGRDRLCTLHLFPHLGETGKDSDLTRRRRGGNGGNPLRDFHGFHPRFDRLGGEATCLAPRECPGRGWCSLVRVQLPVISRRLFAATRLLGEQSSSRYGLDRPMANSGLLLHKAAEFSAPAFLLVIALVFQNSVDATRQATSYRRLRHVAGL